MNLAETVLAQVAISTQKATDLAHNIKPVVDALRTEVDALKAAIENAQTITPEEQARIDEAFANLNNIIDGADPTKAAVVPPGVIPPS